MKKASTIFGYDAPNSVSSLSLAAHLLLPVLRKWHLEATSSAGHVCPWKIGKWASVPDIPSAVIEDSDGAYFAAFQRKWHIWE